MDGQARREQRIRAEAEAALAEQLTRLDASPSALEDVLARLEDLERGARLTSDAVATPIYASGLLQALIKVNNIEDAIDLFGNLIKRRSQTNEAIVRCGTVLEEYLQNNYDDDTDYSTLEPLLQKFTKITGHLIVVEAINVRQSIRLLRMYRKVGNRDGALKIAESLSADVAASLAYVERVEYTLEQLDAALYFKELVLAEIVVNRIKEKTLKATTAAVYRKGDFDLWARLSLSQRRYYTAKYLIALGDRRMDSLCEAAWAAASTYLAVLDGSRLNKDSQLSNDDLMKCSTLLSTAAVAGLLAGFSKVSSIMAQMRASTLYAENIFYCARAHRCVSSLIHPFAKSIFRSPLHPWKKIEEDFRQGRVCPITAYIPLPQDLVYNSNNLQQDTYTAKIELFSHSLFSDVHESECSASETMTDADVELMWGLCKSSYIEGFMAQIMRFYKSTTIDNLAQLVGCDPLDVEMALVNYDGYLAIDRPQRTIQMSRPLSNDEQLSQWLDNTRKAVINIAKISQLLEMDVRLS